MNNKVEYPVKLMLDEQKKPFFPFTTINSVLISGTDKTAADLFNERYTKDEVDQIIKDLGTLQRLCGRVDSYADLLKIKDPKPGDTYLVGPTAENNSEYMYIGDEWEELGPMIDLTVFYLKEETDALLKALDEKLTEAMIEGDVEHLNVAKELIEQINTRLGANANLNTSDKSTIVNAVNEVRSDLIAGLSNTLNSANSYTDSKVNPVDAKIGNLDDLATANHSNLVNAINELNKNINDLSDRLAAELQETLQAAQAYTDSELSKIAVPTLRQITIPTNAWTFSSTTNTYNATVQVEGVTAISDVIVTPAPSSINWFQSMNVVCTDVIDGALIFTSPENIAAATVDNPGTGGAPAALIVNVVIM